MNTINWANYDSKEFENFCNALLTFEVSKKVKPFSAPGRDGGIDASYTGEYDGMEGSWRFQFKFHQVVRKQGFHQLKRDVISEVEKLKGEDFFVLMTNVELLPQELTELESTFESYIQNNSLTTRILIWEGAKLHTLFLRHPLISIWMDEGFETAQLQEYQVFFKKGLEATDFVPNTLSNYFIGRNNGLSELANFLDSDKKIALVEGEAGIGKTRLIIEFFKQYVDTTAEWKSLVLASRNIDFDRIRNSLSLKGNFIILVDDAHSYDSNSIADLKKLSEISKGKVKLLLTARSMEASKSLQDIREFDQDDILKLNLTTLDRHETKAAFKPYLEKGAYWYHIRELIDISYGRPVLIVAILRAIFNNTRIETIRQNDFLKSYVANYFDEFHLELGKMANISKLRSKLLLENIALIEPFNFDDQHIIEKLSSLHEMARPEIILALKLLKDYGFVSGRYEQSIRPDYYSDIILENINATDASNYIMSFAAQLDNIIINLSSVDEGDSGKGLLLNNTLNEYVGWIAVIDDPTITIEMKISIIGRILHTVGRIVFVKPEIAKRAVDLYLDNIVKDGHPVRIEFEANLKYPNYFTEPLGNKITSILSSLLSFPEFYRFVFDKIFKFYELSKNSKLSGIYSYSKKDVVENFKLNRQFYFIRRLKHRPEDNVANYILIREILKQMLVLDFTVYEPSATDRDSLSITRYALPRSESVRMLRLETIHLFIYYYQLSVLSEYKLETLKAILDIVRGIFASHRNPKTYQNNSEIAQVLDFLEKKATDFELLEQKEVLERLSHFIKWNISSEFIPQITRIKDLLKPKNLAEHLSQLFSNSVVLSLKGDDMRNYIAEECDNIVGTFNEQELAVAMRKFLEPQPYPPHYFWEFLRNLLQKHTQYAIYFHDYLFKIKSNLYYQYASGILSTLYFEKNLQEKYWSRINQLEVLDTWQADNVILNSYGNRIPGSASLSEKDTDLIIKIFEKGRTENNQALAGGLQTVIAFKHPHTENIIASYLRRVHQRDAEMFFIWLSDNSQASKELIKTVVLQNTIRFYLSFEIERILASILKYYGVEVVFEYLVSRFNYKKQLVIETKSLMGYDFVPPAEHSNLFEEEEPAKNLQMFELALNWYIELDADGGHLFYAKDMLSYIQTQQVITNEIYAIYERLIEKFNDNLNSLARIADSLSIFYSKDSKLVALVIKIFDLVIYLKDQDSDLLSHTRYALYDALTSMGVKTGVPGQPFQVDIELRDLLTREINQLPDYFESKQFLKEILINLNNQIDQIRDHDNETW